MHEGTTTTIDSKKSLQLIVGEQSIIPVTKARSKLGHDEPDHDLAAVLCYSCNCFCPSPFGPEAL